MTDFRSPYRHGFLRVAASTLRTSIADPPRNAESVLRVARECQDEGVALVVFPELTLTGYSIEDVLLQDTLLDSVEAALLDVMAGSADLSPVSWAPRCATGTGSTTARWSYTAGGCWCPASSSWQDFGLGKVGDARVGQPTWTS